MMEDIQGACLVKRVHVKDLAPRIGFPPVSTGRLEDVLKNRPFVLQVGPSSVALRGRVDLDGWRLGVAYHQFTRPAHQPQLSLAVKYEPTTLPRGNLIFQVGELASFYRDGKLVIIRLGEETTPSRADRVVTLDASALTGTLVVDVDHSTKPAASYPLQYPLEDLLFRSLLADRGALIVHGCGVVWQGKGYLFVGSSGVGKSTTARLWKAAGASVLNDDRVVLEFSTAWTSIHPTPWSGEYSEVGGRAATLAAIYLLKKGQDVVYESLRPSVAGALLFAKSFPPLWDPQRIGSVLEIIDRVCRAVPIGWLQVPPDQRAVEWVQRHG